MARKTIEMRLAEIEAQKEDAQGAVEQAGARQRHKTQGPPRRARSSSPQGAAGRKILPPPRRLPPPHIAARPHPRRRQRSFRRSAGRLAAEDISPDAAARAPLRTPMRDPHVRNRSRPHSFARGRTPAKAHPRLRDPRIYRQLRSRRGRQARRNGIAARKARPLPETLWLLERRPGADRSRQE